MYNRGIYFKIMQLNVKKEIISLIIVSIIIGVVLYISKVKISFLEKDPTEEIGFEVMNNTEIYIQIILAIVCWFLGLYVVKDKFWKYICLGVIFGFLINYGLLLKNSYRSFLVNYYLEEKGYIIVDERDDKFKIVWFDDWDDKKKEEMLIKYKKEDIELYKKITANKKSKRDIKGYKSSGNIETSIYLFSS